MPMMDIGQLNNINRFPFIEEREQKLTLLFYKYNHYTLACKRHTNTDNSVFCIDETCKMRYNKYIKFY